MTAKPRRSAVLPAAALAIALVVSAPASAQWPADPLVNLAIADRSGEQVVPIVASSPDCGTYVAWFDGASGNFNVYLQRLDSSGREQWPHDGILISDKPQNSAIFGEWTLIADRAGNAVLAFTDERDGGDLDVHAYKVDPAGSMLWGADGVTVSSNPDFEPGAKVVEASDGDFVIAWQRDPATGSGDLMLQRLSPDGVPRLAPGGIAVISVPGEQPGFVGLAAADGGSVILSWVRDITTFSSPRHVRAAKFSAAGAPLWASPVNVYDAFPVPIGYYPRVQADGRGGAFLVWHRSDGAAFSSFLQHLDAAGDELLPHNGLEVATTPGMFHINPTLSLDPETGAAFVFWDEENLSQSMWGLFAQKVSAAGAREWGGGGRQLLAVDSVYKSFPRSVPYGDGAMVFLLDHPAASDRIVAMRVDGAGNPVWGAAPVVVSDAASTKGRYPVTSDGHGVAKVVWEDDRGGSADVYGQSVNPKGSLGPPDFCLHRFDLTSLVPYQPPPSAVFQATSVEDISLQGAPYRCPFSDGDLEPDPDALADGVPLALYQVDLHLATLRLVKAGTTVRFRF